MAKAVSLISLLLFFFFSSTSISKTATMANFEEQFTGTIPSNMVLVEQLTGVFPGNMNSFNYHRRDHSLEIQLDNRCILEFLKTSPNNVGNETVYARSDYATVIYSNEITGVMMEELDGTALNITQASGIGIFLSLRTPLLSVSKIVVDLDQDPRTAHFYDHQGTKMLETQLQPTPPQCIPRPLYC